MDSLNTRDLNKSSISSPIEKLNNDLDKMENLLSSLDQNKVGGGLVYYDEKSEEFLPRSSYLQSSQLFQQAVNVLNPAASCKELIKSFKNIEKKSQEIFNKIKDINGTEDELNEIKKRLTNIINTIDKKSQPCIEDIIKIYNTRTNKLDQQVKISDIKNTSNSIFSTMENGKVLIENKIESLNKSQIPIELQFLNESSVNEEESLINCKKFFKNLINTSEKNTINEIAEKARELLNENPKPNLKINNVLFAYIELANSLHETELTGKVSQREGVEFWNDLLTTWDLNLFTKIGIDDSTLQKMKLLFDQFKKVIQIGQDDPSKVHSYVINQLNKEKECVLPAGWRGDPGHVMVCQLHIDRDDVVIELITLGGGAEYHSSTQDQGKSKVNLKWNPVRCPLSKFNSSIGKAFIDRLLNLHSNQGTNQNPLGAEDLYGLVAMTGEVSPEEKQPTLALTSQHSGTCGESGIRAALYNIILSNPTQTISEKTKTLKHFIFHAKYECLLEKYKQYKQSPEANNSLEALVMMQEAAKLQLIYLLKMYPNILSEEEFLLTYMVVNEIKIETASKLTAIETSQVLHLPNKVQFINKPLPLSQVLEDQGTIVTVQGGPKIPPFYFDFSILSENKTPEKIISALSSFNSRIDANYASPENLEQIYLFVTQYLPISTGEIQDEFWDNVPEEKLPILLNELNKLVKNSYNVLQELPVKDKQKLYFISFYCYDIACQIAYRIKVLKIEDYSFDNSAINLDKYHFQDAVLEDAIMKIQSNFQKRKNRKPNVLFEQNVNPDFNKPIKSSFAAYIQQFVIGKCYNPDDFATDEKRTNFPLEYYDLRELAALSSMKDIPKPLCWSTMNYKRDGISHYRDDLFQENFSRYTPPQGKKDLISKKAGKTTKFSENQIYLQNTKKVHWSNHEEINIENLSMTPADRQSLYLAVSEPSLAIIEILNWTTKNLTLLDDIEVKRCIYGQLFSFSTVPTSLKDSCKPTIDRMQAFINEGFAFYSTQPNKLDTFLWLCNVAVSLQGIVNKQNPDLSFELPDFYSILEKSLKEQTDPGVLSDLYEHMLLTFSNKQPDQMSSDNYQKMLQTRIALEFVADRKNIKGQNLIQAFQIYLKHHIEIENHIKALPKDQLSSSLNNILAFAFHESPENFKYEWQVDQNGNLTCNEYQINFNPIEVYHHSQKMQDISKEIVTSENFKKIVPNKQATFSFYNNFYYMEPDQTLRICLKQTKRTQAETKALGNKDTYVIQKLIDFDGEENWYEYIPSYLSIEKVTKNKFIYEYLEKEIPPNIIRKVIPEPLCQPPYTHWISVGQPTTALILNSVDNHLCFNCEQNGDISFLDPISGYPTGSKLLNLTKDECPSELKALIFSEDPSWILVKVRPIGEETDIISEISFPRLNLSFIPVKVENKMKYRCNQYPDYYLSEQQTHPVLHNFKGAFQLEDKTGRDIKFLIPAMELKDLSQENKKPKLIGEKILKRNPFAEQLSLNTSYLLPIGEVPYFIYSLEKDKKGVIPDSPTGALYISLFYRACGDYKAAFDHLAYATKPENYSDLEINLIDKMLLPDTSPAATAFDLQLGDLIRKHQVKHIKGSAEGSAEGSSDLPKQHHKDLQIRNFNNYFNNCAEKYTSFKSEYKEDISAIPKFLRLTKKQEAKFKIGSQIYQPKPTKSLLIKLFNGGRWIKDYDNKLQVGMPLLLTTNTVRFSENYLMDNFFSLYEQARLLKSPEEKELFKMNLFFISQSIKAVDGNGYLLLILIKVLLHPEKFADLSNFIKSAPKFDERITKYSNQLKEIIKVAEGIPITDADKQFFVKQKGTTPPILEKAKTLPLEDIHKTKGASEKILFMPQISQEFITLAKTPLSSISPIFVKETVERKKTSEEFVVILEDIKKQEKAQFKEEASPLSNKINETLITRLTNGHQIEQDKIITVYTVDSNELKIFETKLKEQEGLDDFTVNRLTNEIVKLANSNLYENKQQLTQQEFLEFVSNRAQKESLQLEKLTLTDVLSQFLHRDPHLLKKMNPALTNKTIQDINNKVIELFIYSSRIDQIQSAQKLIEKIKKANGTERMELEQELAQVAAHERSYDIEKYPELLVYEYMTGLILRKDQCDLLKWVIDNLDNLDNDQNQNMIFQFAAGGGKTKVILPLLAFRIARLGFLPVGLNITALYQIGKKDLEKSLREAFRQNLEVLEIDLHDKLDDSKLNAILESLKDALENKKCLVIKTETWHALNLQYQQALNERDTTRIELYLEILTFLKTKGVSLIDEAHQSLDPLHESNIAIDVPKKLAKGDRELATKIMMMFAGVYKNRDGVVPVEVQKLENTIRLKSNKQALFTADQLKAARESIIPLLLQDPLFDDLKGKEKELNEYLLNPISAPPTWLDTMYTIGTEAEKQLASRVVLAKKLLYETIPHTFSMISPDDYGDAIKPDDLTAAPRHKKQRVTSKFQDVYTTLILTIQNSLQQGLNVNQCELLRTQMLSEHERQKKQRKIISGETAAQKEFASWFPKNDLESSKAPSLDYISSSNHAETAAIAKVLKDNPEAIKAYLTRVALLQVKYNQKKISSTPPDLIDGFKNNIVFSATPGLMETYPGQLQNPKGSALDLSFEANVMQTLNAEKNKKIVSSHVEDLKSFFEELYQSDPDLFKNFCAIIDEGGIFRAFENKEVTDAFLEIAEKYKLPFTGGIYRQESQTGGSQLVLTSNKPKEHNKPLKGSDLRQSLKMMGKDFDKVLLMTLFDRAITTATDILQPPQGVGLLTVGEGTTKTNLLQAAMRLRRLLKGESGQHVMWLIDQELSNQISKENKKDLKDLTVKDLLLWMIENEAKLVEKAVIMRAYQGIQHLVRKFAWDKINDIKLDPQKRINLYHQYKRGLTDQLEQDPYLLFGKIQHPENTTIVLKEFAKNCTEILTGKKETNIENLLSTEDQATYNLILEQTQHLISEIFKGEAALSQEMHQHQEVRQKVKQEVRQEQTQDTTIQVKEVYKQRYVPERDSLTSEFFLEHETGCFDSIANTLGLTFLPDDILVSDEYLRIEEIEYETTISWKGGIQRLEKVRDRKLKPIPYILVIQEGSNDNPQFKYLICTREGAAFYKKQLIEGGGNNGKGIENKKFILLDAEGKEVQNCKGASGFSEAELSKLQNSDPFKDRVCLLNFISGSVQDINRLKRMAAEWKDERFTESINAIEKLHTGLQRIDKEALEEIHNEINPDRVLLLKKARKAQKIQQQSQQQGWSGWISEKWQSGLW